MTLDLTKAPWPEWEQAPKGFDFQGHLCPLTRAEYAFARHRVNLHEELVRELEKLQNHLEESNGALTAICTETDGVPSLDPANIDAINTIASAAMVSEEAIQRLSQLLARAKP